MFTTSQMAFFTASANIGAIIGAFIGGHVADRCGRRRAVQCASLLFFAGHAMIALASVYASLLLGRLLSGVGVGSASLAVPMYIAEMAPLRVRGMLGACNQLAITIGILLALKPLLHHPPL